MQQLLPQRWLCSNVTGNSRRQEGRQPAARRARMERDAAMTDIPIIFSGPMVRALLAGRKSMTRRLASRDVGGHGGQSGPTRWLLVKPGDRLWVREAFCGDMHGFGGPPSQWSRDCPIWYMADGEPQDGDPRPSIHMPRWPHG
jgi:hypothetical protein